MIFKDINKTLFGKEVKFPIDEKLSIIIGPNGSYKTLTLELLREYFTEQGENVLYFEAERRLMVTKDQIEAAVVMNKLMYDNFFNEIDLNASLIAIDREYETYMNRGTTQLLNFLTQITLSEECMVMIDMPERNLDMHAKYIIIKAILSISNVKKLIIVTHQPEIINGHTDKVIEINTCLNS